ncbi:uncharacterized protein LOC141653430 [Silene latifolia]|uniref:uncharacterized protein LOC141653430 n=1 Tax=Silene latifolia TaxID=37657 RepID=UPI003D782E8D
MSVGALSVRKEVTLSRILWVLNEDQRSSYFNRHGNGNSGSKYKKNKPYYTQYSTANNADMQEDTPLEVEYNRGGHFKNLEQGASSKGNPKVDQDLVNAVCTQVLNVMQSKFTGSMDYSSALANYAGP